MCYTRRNSRSLVLSPRRSRLGRVILFVGLVTAGLCFLRAMPGSPLRAGASPIRASHNFTNAAGALAEHDAAGALGYRTKNIEDIRVGDRVLADNPDVESPSETQVSTATWRKLRLRAEERWDDGTLDDINVETLQPPEWIDAVGARVGASVPLPFDLVEMGLPEDLRGRVESNEPCPAIRSGPGRVVLTTLNHLNRYVLEVSARAENGTTEIIRPTGFHKFYRPTNHSWVSAADLRPGDTLKGTKAPVTVVSNRRVQGTHRVFNMTVEAEHVFRVSRLGALVHNMGCRHTPDQQALKELVDEASLSGNRPLSVADAETILDWADEVGYPGVRANPGDVGVPSNWPGGGGQPHIHFPGVGRSDHIPVQPGVRFR